MIYSCLPARTLETLRDIYNGEKSQVCADGRCIRRFDMMHRGFMRDDKRPRRVWFLSRVEIICNL